MTARILLTLSCFILSLVGFGESRLLAQSGITGLVIEESGEPTIAAIAATVADH